MIIPKCSHVFLCSTLINSQVTTKNYHNHHSSAELALYIYLFLFCKNIITNKHISYCIVIMLGFLNIVLCYVLKPSCALFPLNVAALQESYLKTWIGNVLCCKSKKLMEYRLIFYVCNITLHCVQPPMLGNAETLNILLVLCLQYINNNIIKPNDQASL